MKLRPSGHVHAMRQAPAIMTVIHFSVPYLSAASATQDISLYIVSEVAFYSFTFLVFYPARWFCAILLTEQIYIHNFTYSCQAREFANELRAGTKASRNPTVWLDGSAASNQSTNSADTSTVSEAYAKMLTIFIPLLVDEVTIRSLKLCLSVFCYFLLPFKIPSSHKHYILWNTEFIFCTLHVL